MSVIMNKEPGKNKISFMRCVMNVVYCAVGIYSVFFLIPAGIMYFSAFMKYVVFGDYTVTQLNIVYPNCGLDSVYEWWGNLRYRLNH